MTSRASCAFLCLATLALASCALRAQSNSATATAKLSAARPLYYTPTTQGLKSFHCNLDFNWKDLLARYSGSDVPDDNPFLQYLRTIHLAINDDLKSSGQLEWTAPGAPPAGQEDTVAHIKDGMQQMMTGFFSSWNAYMNGNMIPAPDATTTVNETTDGLRLHATAEGTDVTELFDRNLLLTEAHVVQPTSDVYAYPTYTDTPDGRIVSAIRTVYRQPPTAPPAELNLHMSYTQVQGFHLPETLQYELKNIGAFAFKFTGCSAQTTDKVPGKL